MRTTALVVAGTVGTSSVVVALALALGFGVSLSRAAGQSLPMALAFAFLAGLLVELDRRTVW